MKIYCDGETYNNGQKGQDTFIVVLKKNKVYEKHLGNKTCNEGELMAILFSIYQAKKGDTIYSDSQLAVNLSLGKWKARKKHLRPYVRMIKRELKKKVKIKWIPREKNLAGIYIEDLQYANKRHSKAQKV